MQIVLRLAVAVLLAATRAGGGGTVDKHAVQGLATSGPDDAQTLGVAVTCGGGDFTHVNRAATPGLECLPQV